jgi:hypothetical protein
MARRSCKSEDASGAQEVGKLLVEAHAYSMRTLRRNASAEG